MRVAVYSGYGAGFGDISAGRKLVELARTKYPDAEVQQYTNSFEEKTGSTLKVALEKYDPRGEIHPMDLRKKYPKPDVIIVGPMITDTEKYIHQLAGKHKSVPIILMAEYDCGQEKGDVELQRTLKAQGFKNVFIQRMGLERGQGVDAAGIFIDRELATNAAPPKSEDLDKTKEMILDGHSVEDYQSAKSIVTSYSHRNFERMLHVDLCVRPPVKDADLIILGEEIAGNTPKDPPTKRDLPILKKNAEKILAAGYSQVVYVEPGQGPVVLASSDKPGPIYRVVHTGKVSSTEAKALRALSNDVLGGATGDQSYSEAISKSPVCVYETQHWKQNFTVGMMDIAEQIEADIEMRDPRPIQRVKVEVPNSMTGVPDNVDVTVETLFRQRETLSDLPRAILLLSQAASEEEYQELSELLSKPGMIDKFTAYQESIMRDHDLERNFSKFLDEKIDPIIERNTSSALARTFTSFKDAMSGVRQRFTTREQSTDEQHETKSSADKGHSGNFRF